MSKKQPPRYEPEEKITAFVLRLPDGYNNALEELVNKKVAKSKNELIVQIIGSFLTDLKREAEKRIQ